MSQGNTQPSNAPQQSPQRQLEDDRMDIDLAENRVPAAEPAQPPSRGQTMDEALTEIQTGIQNQASSRPVRNARRQPSGPQSVDIMRQRMRDMRLRESSATEASAPAKRTRTSSAGSPTNPDPAKRPKVESHHVIDFPLEKPAKNRPTSFDHLYKPAKVPCAVMIDEDFQSIMGHPLRSQPEGGIKLNLDPGRHGEPSIGLDFRILDQGMNVTKKDDAYKTFALGWEPGVKIGGQWMLENAKFYEASKQENEASAEFCYPQAIRELVHKQKDSDRLICLTFQSNHHKTSLMEDVEWTAHWPAAYRNLQRMYHGTDPSYRVTVWFCTPTTNADRVWGNCLRPFADAVKDHTPPFHQYLDDDDMPYIQEDLATVAEIGNGMYKRLPKVKSNGRLTNRTGTVSYHTLPRRVTWNSIKSFHVMHGVPIVRDMQYVKGLHIGLEADWHRVYLQRMPALKVGDETVHPSQKMQNTCLAGIRLTPDANGVKESIPEAGETIIVEFSNADTITGKAHETIENELCYGHVSPYGGKSFLEKTGTDFSVLLTMPRNHKFPTKPSSKMQPDNQLALAKIRVKVNLLPAKRNARAFNKFCDERYLPELLDPIRLAMWGEPSHAPTEVIDLTEGPAHARSKENSAKYRSIIQGMQAKRRSNASQDAVLMAPSAMKGRIAVVQGPPGAGKTRTLRDMIIALAKVGHKVLCVASSNVAVDTDAIAVWNGLTPEERKVIKCLRLETNGAEKAQRLTKLNYADYTGEEGEADRLPEYAGPEMASDTPAVRHALDVLCTQWALRESFAAKMFEKYEDVEEAFQAINNYDAMKRSNVPNGMTLDYRQWELTVEDRRQARLDFEAACNDLAPAELDRQLQAREIYVDKFDQSFNYRDYMSKNVDQGGLTEREEKDRLEIEVDFMTRRTFGDTHIMFATASNCGGPLLEDVKDFAPTVIICDESGQIDIPSFTVPLTVFDSWEGCLIVGDTVQLEPTILSGNYNEFIANAKLSPLSLLSLKETPSIMLEEQYRMAPACSRFPRDQFYNGKGLKDSEAVLQDNPIRKAIRKFTKSIGIDGDNGDGSEYVVTDVVHGYSRVELGGTSLVNYANADVITRMVKRLLSLEEGLIKPGMIKILPYYQGERRLLRKKLAEMDVSQAIKDAVEISTVDSFQGKESQIVIIDMVAAKGNLGDDEPEPEFEDDDEMGDEDPGTAEYVKTGRVTGHVRNGNRLNVALTRGQSATLVVCQAGLLAGCLKKSRGKHYNAVVNMISDAQNRKCFHTDYTLDSHPESVKRREQLTAATLQRNTETRRIESLRFIADGRRHWEYVKNNAPLPAIPAYSGYRVQGGHTTRPIGNPNLVRTADDFDEDARVAAASVATAQVDAENRRTLDLATQASIAENYPLLPTQHGKEIEGGQQNEGEAMVQDGEDEVDWLDPEGQELEGEPLSPGAKARLDAELGLENNQFT